MKTIATTRIISAPLERVFQTVSDIRNFSKAIPHITNIEFLSEQKKGVGTKFRETRLMNSREQSVDLEVTEFVENQHVRMVSDAGGTIWDTVFTVTQLDDAVEMSMRMEVRPHKFLARIMNLLIRKMVVKAIANDMDAVKVFCETPDTSAEI